MVTIQVEPRLYRAIREHIGDMNSVDIAVAYVKRSGIELLKDYLESKNIRLVTGFGFNLTEPEALEELIDLGAKIKVFGERKNFHPKIYLLKDNRVFCSFGSSNLSGGGLLDNIEANICLKGSSDETSIKSALDFYEKSLWDSPLAVSLTEEILQEYERFRPEIHRPKLTLESLREEIQENARNYVRGRNSWLLITSHDNFRKCLCYGLWGVEHETDKIKETRPGDLAYFYVKGEYKVYGPFEITSEVFHDTKPIWDQSKPASERRSFVDRVRIGLRSDIRDTNFRPLISNLNFIKSHSIWGTYLQMEMRKLNQHDSQVILSSLT